MSPLSARRRMSAWGCPRSPELVESSLDRSSLSGSLLPRPQAAAADGARLAEAAGLGAEPAVARGSAQPWEPILAAAASVAPMWWACGTRGRGPVARSVLGSTSSKPCCITLTGLGGAGLSRRWIPCPTGRRSSPTTGRPPRTRRSRPRACCYRAGRCKSFTSGSRRSATVPGAPGAP